MSSRLGLVLILISLSATCLAELTSEYDNFPNMEEAMNGSHSEGNEKPDESTESSDQTKVDPCERIHRWDVKFGEGCTKYPTLKRDDSFTLPGVYYQGCYKLVSSSDGAVMVRVPDLKKGTSWTIVDANGIKRKAQAGEVLGAGDFFGQEHSHFGGSVRLVELSSLDGVTRQVWVPISASCGWYSCPDVEKAREFVNLDTK